MVSIRLFMVATVTKVVGVFVRFGAASRCSVEKSYQRMVRVRCARRHPRIAVLSALRSLHTGLMLGFHTVFADI
jgi:hypothetical protein